MRSSTVRRLTILPGMLLAACTSGVAGGPVADAGTPTVGWSQLMHSASEGTATVHLSAVLSAASDQTVEVSVAVSAEDSTAASGTDFATVTDSLSFPPGTMRADHEVTLFDEDVIEPNERLVLVLESPEHAELGEQVVIGLTILDAQTPTALATAAVSAADVSVDWSDNSSNEAGFLLMWTNEYTPWRKDFSRAFAADEVSGSSWTLSPNTGYNFRVAAFAVSESEHGEPSAALRAVTLPTTGTAPASPTAAIVTDTFANEVDLSWQDNAGDERGFRIERSTSAGSGFSYVGTTSPDISTFVDQSVEPETTYYYQVRAFNEAGDSSATMAVQATTTVAEELADAPGTWLIVFSNRGVPVPASLKGFLCTRSPFGMPATLHRWMRREANKYGQAAPFDAIDCLTQEVELPALLQTAATPTTQPLDESGVISYLEDSAGLAGAEKAAFEAAAFVTIVHFLPEETVVPGIGHHVSGRYSFLYVFPPASTPDLLYPEVSLDGIGRILLHELSHALGATDKYMDSPAAACLTNPSTGKQYEGSDIMCHRVYDPIRMSYYFPPLELQTISRGTADEIY
jgi:hypothetical protein